MPWYGSALSVIDENEETSEMAYLIRKHKFQVEELLSEETINNNLDSNDLLKLGLSAIYPCSASCTQKMLYENLLVSEGMLDLLEEITGIMDTVRLDVGILVPTDPLEVHDIIQNSKLKQYLTVDINTRLKTPPISSVHLVDCISMREYVVNIQKLEENLLTYAYQAELYYRALLTKLQTLIATNTAK